MPSPVLSTKDVKRSVKSSQKPAYVRARLEDVVGSFRDQFHGVEKGKCMAERMKEVHDIVIKWQGVEDAHPR